MAQDVRDQVATPAQAGELVGRIAAGFAKTSALPAYVRSQALAKVADGIEKEAEEFARLISSEVKKPLKEARREVGRAVFTFRWAAEEAKRFVGEVLPIDFDANTEGRLAFTRRFPRGPALLITPFNFPLNLVAHKVAPAMAVGTSFVLKPAPHAPRTALRLAALIRAAGWPADGMAVVTASNDIAELLVKDERLSTLSFTGSARVGWHLKAVAGKKHVVLELGGNAAVLVAADADVPWAAARCAWGAYYYSGQVCISVQRIIVEKPVYGAFKELFLKNVAELKVGDPLDEKTDIGPLINAEAAARVESWIQEAVTAGAAVVCGGRRRDDVVLPTLLENVPDHCKLSCEEAFGPVATLEMVDSRRRGLERFSVGSYGLQAGLFTNDLGAVMRSWGSVPVGGLIVNDIPSFRSDAMPYGGTRDSGIGREGVRYAMEEFSELRTLVVKP